MRDNTALYRSLPTALLILARLGYPGAADAQSLTAFQQVTSLPYPPNFNIYVNSITGSDSNAGTSYNLPLLTLTAAALLVKQGGSVCLEHGSHWRADFNPTVTRTTLSGCGPASLPQPIIDASDVLVNANMAATSAGALTYKTSGMITFVMGSSTLNWGVIYETGGPSDSATGQALIQESCIANYTAVENNAGSYCISGMYNSSAGFFPSSATIYIHPADNTNPTTNGYVYEVSQRIGVTGPDNAGMTVMDLETRKNSYNNGSIVLTGNNANATVINVLARDGGKHNMLLGGNSSLSYSTLIDQFYPPPGGGGTGMLVLNVSNGLGQNLTVSNTIFQQSQKITGNGNPQLFLSHSNDAVAMGNVTFNNDFFINAQSGAPATVTGINATNMTSITTNGVITSELLNSYTMPVNWTSINDWLFSDVTNNQPIVTSVSGITIKFTGYKSCAKNVAATTGVTFYDNHGGNTIMVTGGDNYIGSPNANTNLAFWNHSGVADTWIFNGVDIGGGVASWIPLGDANAAATFAGSNNDIYEASNFGHFAFRGTNSTSVANWITFLAGISMVDTGATSSGGGGTAPCTLPTLPSVI